jgi:hypothetical protein
VGEPEKPVAQSTANDVTKPEIAQTKKVPTVCCSLCTIEMSQGKTKFKIDEWEGQQPNTHLGEFGEDLPVTIHLCPKCGKIEFKAQKEH